MIDQPTRANATPIRGPLIVVARSGRLARGKWTLLANERTLGESPHA